MMFEFTLHIAHGEAAPIWVIVEVEFTSDSYRPSLQRRARRPSTNFAESCRSKRRARASKPEVSDVPRGRSKRPGSRSRRPARAWWCECSRARTGNAKRWSSAKVDSAAALSAGRWRLTKRARFSVIWFYGAVDGFRR
jgi:hypothetical protein